MAAEKPTPIELPAGEEDAKASEAAEARSSTQAEKEFSPDELHLH